MHKFAQHFLINSHAILRIVESLELTPDDTVLEIGPGKGALTTYLVRRAKDVHAVEVDEEMIKVLQNKLGAATNFFLHHADILDFDFNSLPAQGKIKVVGNLPYNLTSPILRRLCDWDGWTSATVMVQKEVGDRLCAKAGSSDFGALTVGINLTCVPTLEFILSENSYKPPPRVKSAVVRLDRRETPLTPDVPFATKVIQSAFQQRRKTILNSLSHGLNLTKEEIQLFFDELKIDSGIRAENLTVDQYVQLTRLLKLKLSA